MILTYAIVNGALELLPDSLATMATIPLQIKGAAASPCAPPVRSRS